MCKERNMEMSAECEMRINYDATANAMPYNFEINKYNEMK